MIIFLNQQRRLTCMFFLAVYSCSGPVLSFAQQCGNHCQNVKESEASRSTSPTRTVFYAIGDTPYTYQDRRKLPCQLRALPTDADFVIHLGDIKEGNAACTEECFEKVACFLKLSPAPVFVIRGDNEWNDCSNPTKAGSLWEKIFTRFYNNFSKRFSVTHQTNRDENFTFIHGKTLFIGLNLVADKPISENEKADRLDSQQKWTQQLINNHRQQVDAVVIFGHGNLSDNQPFFQDLKSYMAKTLNNALPIMYLQGNKHAWEYEHNAMGSKNFLSVTITGGTSEGPMRVEVNSQGTTLGDVGNSNGYTGSAVFQIDRTFNK